MATPAKTRRKAPLPATDAAALTLAAAPEAGNAAPAAALPAAPPDKTPAARKAARPRPAAAPTDPSPVLAPVLAAAADAATSPAQPASAAAPAARPNRPRRTAATLADAGLPDAVLAAEVLGLLQQKAPSAVDVAVDATAGGPISAPVRVPVTKPPRARARPPAPEPAAMPAPAPAPKPAPTGPADSAIVLLPGAAHQVLWQAGHACPKTLLDAAAQHVDAAQCLAPDDDIALPLLLRLADAAGHSLAVDAAVWPHLAAHRDARSRLALLESAYPAGAASPALHGLLRAPLAAFQAEGALFAVVAGRALLADERGLGKSVQAIAAAALWQRHCGVQRVVLVCAAADVAAWQRAWHRFAPQGSGLQRPQHMDGGLHQRQALWSQPATLRILSPDALASDAAHLAQWAPGLVIVDEPQGLGLRDEHWAALQSPHALVLCGAPLAEQPLLMQTLVAWLDDQRLGPLAALQELQAAADEGRPLDDASIERLTASLSRLMLQRARADVAGQLPGVVHSERLLPLAPAQREAHDAALAQARQLLVGWQHSGYLADADQWRLLQALAAMQQAALRAQPGVAGSALADAVVQALATQISAWAGTAGDAVAGTDGPAPLQVRVLCSSRADLDQLAARLSLPDGVQLALAGDDWPAGLDVVVQLGVPWRSRRTPVGAQPPAGQQWLCLVGQGSLDAGLFDTQAQRLDMPRSLLDGGRGFLQGARLQQWLMAVQAALAQVDANHNPSAPDGAA